MIEVLVATALLGIVMLPLTMAMNTAWRTVFGIQEKLSSSADAQLLSATFPADVQSAGATGVNPTDPVNVNTCAVKAEDGETPLIMFVWDEDLGVSNQSVARYLAKGSGEDSQIIRRFCDGTADAVDTVVARNFGTPGIQDARLFTLGDNGLTSPQCTATSCLIKITGQYNFQLNVDRRVPGSAPGAYVPDAPTNVHALGTNNRATVYWTNPSDNGAAITGYYLEETPGGAVLGPFVTDGVTGAQVNGLTNGQSYTFRVRAANVLGPGPYSVPTGAVTPGPSTPDAPIIATVTADPAVNGQAALTWGLPSGYNNGGAAVVGYKVYAQHAPDAPIVLDVSNPAATSATVTGLADNTNYAFRISARNSYGEGSPSASSSTVLTLPGKPGTPTAVFTGVPNSVDVTFALPTSGDFTSFTNFRAHILESSTYTTPVAAATACPGTTPTTCTLTVTGLGSAQSYTIKVQAQNATGWGPESDAVTNVDFTAPVVTITTPSTTYVSSATPTIGGAAGVVPGDLPGITLNVYAGATATGSPVQTLTPTASGSAWSAALSPALAAGQYTVVATQRDSTGNVGTSNARTFTIDTVAPTGSITAPGAAAYVHGSAVTVSSNSADSLSGVASVQFQYSPGGANSWTSIATDTAGPYNATWDVSYLTDDDYDLRVITTDNVGNTFTSPIRTVNVDNSAPTIGAANVSGTLGTNNWYTSNVTVTWPTPTDPSGIASTTGCGTTTISSNTTGQVVTCSATDNAGNTGSNSVTVKRDATAPSSATLDAVGAFVANGEVLTGSGADSTSGIGSITYLSCSGTSCTPATTIGSSSTGPSYSVAWTGLPASGSYQVLAKVFDNAGNSTSSAKQTVTVDNNVPSGSITLPAANAWVGGSSVTVTSSSADTGSGVASAQFQWAPNGGSTWTTIGTDTGSPYSATWDTSALTDASYDLRVITTDNVGNTFTSTPVRTVRVDNTDPTVANANVSGTAGTNGWYTGTVTVTWPSQTDAGSGVASTSGCGTTTVSTDTAGQTVTCSATDNAGNVGSNSVIIKRDAAVPTVATLSALGSYINNGDVLTGTGTDATSGIGSITYLYCAGTSCTPATTIGSSTAGPTFPVTWNSQPANGSYQVLAKVFDAAGNFLNSAKQTVTIDNTAPTGSITAPTANQFIRQTFSVTSNSLDTGGSLVQSATFQYSVSGAGSWNTIATDTTSPYAASWNTTSLTDGAYDLRVITQDGAGNSTTSAIVTARVDNTAPVIAAANTPVGTLGNNGWYTSNVSVTWPLPTDAYSGLASNTCVTGTTVSAETTGQNVTCTATDNVGNVATSATVTIKKDSIAPATATLTALGTINDGKSVTGGGTDATSGLGSITYYYSATACTPNIAIGSSTTATTYPVTWTGMPADGSYQVLARVFDNAGNSKDSTVQTATIDNTVPAMTAMSMQDSNTNGKVDRVVVTFNQTLASSTATAPWTLANVPSGGSLLSVATSGSTATLTLTEGSGAKDTAVGSFTVALAASSSGIRDAVGNQSSFAAAAPSDAAKPVPVTVQLNNKSGNSSGEAESGDYATITYSEPLSVASICTTWSGDTSDKTTTATATMTNNGSIDPVTLGSPCANFGTLNPNASYLTTTRTFPSSTIAWDVSAETLRITLGNPSGSVSTGVSSAVPTYSPTASLKDPAGNTMLTTAFSGTSSRF